MNDSYYDVGYHFGILSYYKGLKRIPVNDSNFMKCITENNLDYSSVNDLALGWIAGYESCIDKEIKEKGLL